MERTPFNPEEAEWETKKVIDDYKFKLQKAEQDISTCQTNVSKWALTQNIGAIHTLDMLKLHSLVMSPSRAGSKQGMR